MKLNIRSAAIAGAILWGILGMFVVGVANLIWPGYGGEFLRMMSSIYPGYHAAPSFGQVIVGTLYGLVDGGIGGAILAWLYNSTARPATA